MSYEIVNPEALGEPRGWNHGMLGKPGARALFVAGQVASDASGAVPDGMDFVRQFGRALEKVAEVVTEAGGAVGDIGRMTIYVTDMDVYRASRSALGGTWRGVMGRHYPAMTLVEVSRLVDGNALVEIDAAAMIGGGEA